MESFSVDRIERKISILEEERERDKSQVQRFEEILKGLNHRRTEAQSGLDSVKERIIQAKESEKGKREGLEEIKSFLQTLKDRATLLIALKGEIHKTAEEKTKIIDGLIKREKIIGLLNDKSTEQKISQIEFLERGRHQEATDLFLIREASKSSELIKETTKEKSKIGFSKEIEREENIKEILTLGIEDVGVPDTTFHGVDVNATKEELSQLGREFGSKIGGEPERRNNNNQDRENQSSSSSLAGSGQSSSISNFTDIINRISSWDDLKGKGVSMEVKSSKGEVSQITIYEISSKVVSVEILTEGRYQHSKLLSEQRNIISLLKQSGISVKNFVIHNNGGVRC